MKKLNSKWILALVIALPMLFLVACKEGDDDDDDDTTSFQPVLDENFSYEVNGNNVVFTTTLTGNVWFANEGTEYQTTNQTVTVNLPLAGTYEFTCHSLGGGEELVSEPFDVVIDQDDLSFLDAGMWKHLTGGREGGKTWTLDFENAYFHSMVDYYGDDEAGAIGANAWGPWGGNIDDTRNIGQEISFDGVTKEVTLLFNGETKTGTFTFNPVPRPPADEYMTYAPGTEPYDLWQAGFVEGQYSYLAPISDSIATVTFTNGVHFPLDSNRFFNNGNLNNPSQFLDEDLQEVDIVHLSDSAMVVRVKRTYEGDNENKCWMLYNYIVKEYDYPVEEIPQVEVDWPDNPEAVSADVAAESAKFAGTWKIKNAVDHYSFYPGFWNFETGMNDGPTTYIGTNQESNVFWDDPGYFVPSLPNDTWATPSDSLVNNTMTFDAGALTCVTSTPSGAMVSGTYATNGDRITFTNVDPIKPSRNYLVTTTALIVSIPDTPVAGDELHLAFYEFDNKNQWVVVKYVKQ